jgi:hypothetical protein
VATRRHCEAEAGSRDQFEGMLVELSLVDLARLTSQSRTLPINLQKFWLLASTFSSLA